MTNYEKMMQEMTPEKMGGYIMCPYKAEDIPARCITEEKGCNECCTEWVNKEGEEDGRV